MLLSETGGGWRKQHSSLVTYVEQGLGTSQIPLRTACPARKIRPVPTRLVFIVLLTGLVRKGRATSLELPFPSAVFACSLS